MIETYLNHNALQCQLIVAFQKFLKGNSKTKCEILCLFSEACIRSFTSLGYFVRLLATHIREGVKKNVFFGTLSQTMGRWGSKVRNSLVKTTIQSFLL